MRLPLRVEGINREDAIKVAELTRVYAGKERLSSVRTVDVVEGVAGVGSAIKVRFSDYATDVDRGRYKGFVEGAAAAYLRG